MDWERSLGNFLGDTNALHLYPCGSYTGVRRLSHMPKCDTHITLMNSDISVLILED